VHVANVLSGHPRTGRAARFDRHHYRADAVEPVSRIEPLTCRLQVSRVVVRRQVALGTAPDERPPVSSALRDAAGSRPGADRGLSGKSS
jgi:hypothetical protein